MLVRTESEDGSANSMVATTMQQFECNRMEFAMRVVGEERSFHGRPLLVAPSHRQYWRIRDKL